MTLRPSARSRARDAVLAVFALAFVLALAPGLSGHPASASQMGAGPQDALAQASGVYPETGFRIDDERFLVYFQARGGLPTFGYPVSRRFFLLGTQVQFFQRHVMQLHGDGRVTLLNLLDPGLLDFTSFGNATVPAQLPELALAAPGPGTSNYADAVSLFIARNVPNDWAGRPVGFLNAYLAPGRAVGAADPITQVLIGLELFGFPTSAPAEDPNNASFVYQRFQRAVLHYDSSTGRTQPLLLADYLKALLTGTNLPPTLEAEATAQGSSFLRQYNPARPMWLMQPELLPASDLTAAFEPDDRDVGPTARPPVWVPPAVGQAPSPTPLPGTFGAQGSSGPAAPTAPPAPTPIWTPTPFPTPVSLQPTPTPSPTVNTQPPVIERTEPGTVPIGRDLALRGRHFGDLPGQVLFTGKLTTAQLWSNTFIVVTVPEGAMDGTIRIRRADGVFSNEVGFAPAPTPTIATTPEPTASPTPSVTPTPGPPVVTALSPQQGAPNSTLLVQGSAFGSVAGQVLVGSSQALIESNGWSDTSIVVRVPSDAGSGAVRVSVRRGTDGQLSNFRCFQVLQPTPTTLAGTSTPTPAATPTAASSC